MILWNCLLKFIILVCHHAFSMGYRSCHNSILKITFLMIRMYSSPFSYLKKLFCFLYFCHSCHLYQWLSNCCDLWFLNFHYEYILIFSLHQFDFSVLKDISLYFFFLFLALIRQFTHAKLDFVFLSFLLLACVISMLIIWHFTIF